MYKSYDLVALGEVMLRLSPPKYQRLRHTTNLDICVAGSQLNVVANVAQLGKQTAFLTKLPDNELGYLVRDTCQGYGVDMAHVPMIRGSRLGVNYVEFTRTPRVSVAVYDRAGSAASTVTNDDFQWDRILRHTRFAYTDGIFPGLSATCREATLHFLQIAKAQGCTTCFDMNYREHLWTPQEAHTVWAKLLPYVDIVVTNRTVEETVFGYTGTDQDLLQQHVTDYQSKLICLTTRQMTSVSKGCWKSLALHADTFMDSKPVSFEVVDRFGTGDAFFAGLIYGYQERDVAYALAFGNAMCALAHTLEGDVVHLSAQEVERLMKDDQDFSVRR